MYLKYIVRFFRIYFKAGDENDLAKAVT